MVGLASNRIVLSNLRRCRSRCPPSPLLLEIDVGERLRVGVADDTSYGCGAKVISLSDDKGSAGEETMRRREFVALMGASVAWPFAALAQQAGRTYRLGCLWASPRGDDPAYKAFFDELRRRGFIEGHNLTVEYRA